MAGRIPAAHDATPTLAAPRLKNRLRTGIPKLEKPRCTLSRRPRCMPAPASLGKLGKALAEAPATKAGLGYHRHEQEAGGCIDNLATYGNEPRVAYHQAFRWLSSSPRLASF